MSEINFPKFYMTRTFYHMLQLSNNLYKIILYNITILFNSNYHFEAYVKYWEGMKWNPDPWKLFSKFH